MECLTKKVNVFQPLTIFANHFILNVRLDSEYASVLLRLLCCGSKVFSAGGKNLLMPLHQGKSPSVDLYPPTKQFSCYNPIKTLFLALVIAHVAFLF